MPSSKRLRKASTSSGVLSAQKDTRMAVDAFLNRFEDGMKHLQRIRK